MPLPSMDTSALQRGLDALGNALARQKAIKNERDAATASLQYRQKLNDKINELSQRNDFSGDWGEELRSWSSQTVNDLGAGFSDDGARLDWVNSQSREIEAKVPGFRQVQHDKLQAWNLADLESQTEKGIEAASRGEWSTFAVTHGKLMGNDTAFTQGAVDAYGPEAGKHAQSQIDKAAGLYYQGNIDRIENDTKISWAQKLERLDQASRGMAQTIDVYGKKPSAAQQAKLDAAMQEALDFAQKAAFTEMEAGQLDQLYRAEEADVQNYSDAKLIGAGFVPKSLRAFAQQENLTDSVRSKASDMIAKYTREIPHSTDKDDKDEKEARVKLQRDVLMALAKSGATELTMTEAVNKMATGGYQGVSLEGGMTYAEAQSYAGGLKGLVVNKELSSLAKELKLPEALENRWAEAIGGILNGGSSSYIKDGVLDRDKATKLAETMTAAADKEFINKLLKSNSWFGADALTADDKEIAAFVSQMDKGAGVARFDVAPTAKHPDFKPFLPGLQRMFTAWTGKVPQDTRINQGDRRGQVQFLAGGTWYEAAPDKNGGVTFVAIPGTVKLQTQARPGRGDFR